MIILTCFLIICTVALSIGYRIFFKEAPDHLKPIIKNFSYIGWIVGVFTLLLFQCIFGFPVSLVIGLIPFLCFRCFVLGFMIRDPRYSQQITKP